MIKTLFLPYFRLNKTTLVGQPNKPLIPNYLIKLKSDLFLEHGTQKME